MSRTAEILRARKALMRAAGYQVRKPSKKIPRMREPKAAQLVYQKFLNKVERDIENIVSETLFAKLPDLVQLADFERGGRRRDSAISDLSSVVGGARLIFARKYTDSEIEFSVAEVAQRTNSTNAIEHQRQMRAALGLELIVPEPGLQSTLSGFMADNRRRVLDLVDDEFKAFETITAAGLRQGLRVEGIRQQLIDKIGVSKSKASLLARDQTLKLFGELTEFRQTNVGIEVYVWDTSKDERVRPRHQDLEGTEQQWSAPPIVDYKTGRRAHPGQDYQCRCQGIPKIPEEFFA